MTTTGWIGVVLLMASGTTGSTPQDLVGTATDRVQRAARSAGDSSTAAHSAGSPLGAACGLPAAAFIALFECPPEVTSRLVGPGKESVVLETSANNFTPTTLRRKLASLARCPAEAFHTECGLILTAVTTGPQLELADTGEGYSIALAPANRRTTELALCAVERSDAQHPLAHVTLSPTQTLIAALTIAGRVYVIGIRTEPIKVTDQHSRDRLVSLQHEFAAGLRVETANSKFSMESAPVTDGARECASIPGWPR